MELTLRFADVFRLGGRAVHLAAPVLACIATLALPALVDAGDGDPSTSSIGTTFVLPYEGYIEIDGAPASGSLSVRLDLFASADCTGRLGDCLVYSETRTVEAIDGRFSVAMGLPGGTGISGTLQNVFSDSSQVYIGLAVNGTELAGRQPIVAAPYALWSARSANPSIAGDMNVSGGAYVGATTNVTGGVTIDGGLQVTGDVRMPDVIDGVTVGATGLVHNNTFSSAARVTLASSTNRICVLSTVRIERQDGNESFECRVENDGTNWVLVGQALPYSCCGTIYITGFCNAMCFNWD